MGIRDDTDSGGTRYGPGQEPPALWGALPSDSYATQRPSWGPYIRLPMLPEDVATGYNNTRLMRPMYARFWLNRAGTRFFNPVAEAAKTPRVVPGHATWIVSRPQAAGQYHRLGSSGLVPQPPGPIDILRMKAYGENWTQVRASLGGLLSTLFGQNGTGGQ